jgi:hypothetical protein
MRVIYSDVLLVDGYNVIYAWPELVILKKANFEHARERLTDILASYGAFKKYKVIIVFDAHAVVGPHQCYQMNPGLDIVYTKEGETADSYIEKMVYDLIRNENHIARVYVVTSDWAEQLMILGAGAYRISARELLVDVRKVNKLIKEGFSETTLNRQRHELQNRLTSEIVKRLDELRRGT